MKFAEAYELMKDGKKVRRKGWGGYWYIDRFGRVVIHLKSGEELVGVSNNLRQTLDNTTFNDWEIVED